MSDSESAATASGLFDPPATSSTTSSPGAALETATASESKTVSVWPWSGYWWPLKPTTARNLYDDGEAMHYYDYYVWKTRGYNPGAQQWEKNNHTSTEAWAGHCHAWASASLLTSEPPGAGVTRGGVDFPADVLEGLITASYYVPTIDWFQGTRSYSNDTTTAAYRDLNPVWLDNLLRTYLKGRDRSFIMDIAPGLEVWNFPAFAYRRSSYLDSYGREVVTTTVWFRDALLGETGSSSGYRVKDYTYLVWTTSTGTRQGAWTGDSRYDHPDFAWMPAGHKRIQRDPTTGAITSQVNPRLDESIVEEILGYAI